MHLRQWEQHTTRGSSWGKRVANEARHLVADRALVADAQAGSPGAMDELIAALRPAVLSYCRSRLSSYPGGADIADDVAQETCVAVLKVLPRYQESGAPFGAWVFAIASNKIADAQRRVGRAALLVDELPEQTEPSLNPEELVMTRIDLLAVNELINALPQRMAQVVVMRAHGATAEVVGERLGMSPGAVRVTHHRAVAKLRQLIDESPERREHFATSREPGLRVA